MEAMINHLLLRSRDTSNLMVRTERELNDCLVPHRSSRRSWVAAGHLENGRSQRYLPGEYYFRKELWGRSELIHFFVGTGA